MVPKDVHVPIPDVIKFRILRCGDYLGLSRPKVITSVLIRGRQEDQKEREHMSVEAEDVAMLGLKPRNARSF